MAINGQSFSFTFLVVHPLLLRTDGLFSAEETIEYIVEQKGKSFDPAVIDILLENINEIGNILVEYP